MPTIVAKRKSKCVVCSLPIQEGEFIAYTSEVGARHLTCADRPATQRMNEHTSHCAYCDRLLHPGQGALTLLENQDDPRIHKWIVHCSETCNKQA